MYRSTTYIYQLRRRECYSVVYTVRTSYLIYFLLGMYVLYTEILKYTYCTGIYQGYLNTKYRNSTLRKSLGGFVGGDIAVDDNNNHTTVHFAQTVETQFDPSTIDIAAAIIDYKVTKHPCFTIHSKVGSEETIGKWETTMAMPPRQRHLHQNWYPRILTRVSRIRREALRTLWYLLFISLNVMISLAGTNDFTHTLLTFFLWFRENICGRSVMADHGRIIAMAL